MYSKLWHFLRKKCYNFFVPNCSNEDCGKIKYWIAPYNGTKRLKLLYTNKDINYIVILEQHKKKMLLITAYLVDEPKYLDNLLDEYNRYKK